MHAIQNNAEIAVLSYLSQALKTLGPKLSVIDSWDNGSEIHLNVWILKEGTAIFDLTGTGCEMLSNLAAIVRTEVTSSTVHIPRAAGSLAAFEETQDGQH